jgi:acyl carrier protein/GNAT superfamily N-acetyltransferase
MNGSARAAAVINVLRDSALLGRDRDINTHERLGELGLGLDSLALLQFVLALEKRFDVVIPESIWTERGQLTVQHFVEAVGAAADEPRAFVPEAAPAPTSAEAAADTSVATRRTSTLEQGRSPASASPAVRRVHRLFSRAFTRRKLIIIEFPLRSLPLPAYTPPLKMELRVASEDDAPALRDFWESCAYATIDRKDMDLTLFRRRMEAGDLCLAAWYGSRIVGVDWLFARGYDCPYSGLRLDWPPNTCYGGELSERGDFNGRGVGMALLAFSLAEARRRGYHRQVATVVATNARMLAAAVQLYGFVPSGEIRILRLFGRPRSAWRVRERSGRGATVVL